MCNKVARVGGGDSAWLADWGEHYPYSRPRSWRSTEQLQARSTHASLWFGFFSSSFIFYEIIFLELLVEKEAATRGGGGTCFAGGVWWYFRVGGVGFVQRKAQVAGGRLPACMYVYICTYTLSSTCTLNSYTRIHAHTHSADGVLKSTLVRMGICIAYIFTCTISRCV